MLPLRMIVYDVQDFFAVRDGKLTGTLSKYFFELFPFLNKFNLTILSGGGAYTLDDLEQRSSAMLNLFRSKKVDLDTFLTFLLRTYPNITHGPVIEEHKCQILSRFPIPNALQSYDFTNAFNEIDSSLGLLTLLFFILISLLDVNFRLSNIMASLWKYFAMYGRKISKGYRLKNSKKILIASWAFLTLFLHSIVASLIKTGLISSEKFYQIETIHDMAVLNVAPSVSRYSICYVILKASKDPETERITKDIFLLSTDFLEAKERISQMLDLDPRIVFIGDTGEFSMCQELMCLQYSDEIETMKRPVFAKKPFAARLRNSILNLASPRMVLGKLHYYLYSRFEMKLGYSFFSSHLMHFLTGRHSNLKCLEHFQTTSEAVFSAISPKFFEKVSLSFIVFIPISCLVFCLESHSEIKTSLLVGANKIVELFSKLGHTVARLILRAKRQNES